MKTQNQPSATESRSKHTVIEVGRGLDGYSIVIRAEKPIALINNANGAVAAEVYGHNAKDDTGGALSLARLIAAAPELLAVLSAWVKFTETIQALERLKPAASELLTKSRAAIAKAEGKAS